MKLTAQCYGRNQMGVPITCAYLIDRKTGDLSLIRGDKLIPVEKVLVDESRRLTFSGSVRGLVTVNITAKFIENTVFYRVQLSNPSASSAEGGGFEWFLDALEENRNDRIILQFKDRDGFVLEERPINLVSHSHTSIVDYSDTMTGLRYEDSFGMSPILFSKIESVSFTYALSSLASAPTP